MADFAEAEADADLICAQIAHCLSIYTQGVLPRGLEAFRDRSDLRERYMARERDKLTHDLLHWVTHTKPPPPRHLTFEWSFAELPVGSALTVRGLLTTTRLQNEPRSFEQLRQLDAEVRRNADVLPREQAVPLRIFVESAVRFGMRGWHGAMLTSPALAVRMLSSVRESSTMVWSADVDPRIAWRGGSRRRPAILGRRSSYLAHRGRHRSRAAARGRVCMA